MRLSRKLYLSAAAAVTAAAATVIVVAATPEPASAHGTIANPVSRVYTCYLEGPESPDSDACKAAIAEGGTQPFYDWNEVSLIDVDGRHRERIPDGQLCSAGRDKYRALDLRRSDWPATTVSAGAYTVSLRLTAPHAGSDFEFYVTREGWSPTEPLRWSDLVALEAFRGINPSSDQTFTVTLPERTGRHMLYMIWQRVAYSDEAFYACSDIDYGGDPTPPPPSPTPTPTASPTTSPTGSPTPTGDPDAPAWTAGTWYDVGDRVTYGGQLYQCRQAHTSQYGWEPPNTPALWLQI